MARVELATQPCWEHAATCSEAEALGEPLLGSLPFRHNIVSYLVFLPGWDASVKLPALTALLSCCAPISYTGLCSLSSGSASASHGPSDPSRGQA